MSTEPSAATAPASPGASHAFQAEVSRLLDLMVHSVYTDREVFLRELISNASDACDKLRYEAISRADLLGPDARLAITISIDKEGKRLTVADNGIGMSEAELIDNLGTVARSGTRAFLDRIDAAKEGGSQIGQFGVGFYAAFMVADEIEVLTRKAGETQAWLWVSKGADGFTVSPAPADRTLEAASGTQVRLTLKADAHSYLDEHEIERIVRTYSDNILFPIEIAAADGTARQVNTASALWRRSKSEAKPEDYKQVYQRVAGQFDEPALTLHYSAEGRQSYSVLLFVPSQRPYDLFDPARKGTVKLYVRRVYITEDAALLPSYLRFVKGVIDSEDMPLNISREMLQNNPTVAQIRRAVTSRLLAELETTAAKDNERYAKIWATFGAVVKEGIYEDFERRDQLMKLARFRSTATPPAAESGSADSPAGWRSLADYVAAMRPNQTEIYYLIGDNLDRLRASPQLEAARARGIEVLLLTDPVDSFWTAMTPKFDGKDFKSLTHGDVDLSKIALASDEAPKTEAAAETTKTTIAAIKAALGDSVADVRASQRLVDSASCLVAPGAGPDRGLAKIMQRQQSGAAAKPVLEVNPAHALVQAVGRADGEGRKEDASDLSWLLLDQAMVLEGELPHDPAKFAARLNRLVLRSLPAT